MLNMFITYSEGRNLMQVDKTTQIIYSFFAYHLEEAIYE